MNGARQIRNLALVGFMGVGKSSAGRLAAELLGFKFVDTDEMIEQRAGMCISEIFRTQGEPAFRQLEKDVVAELATFTDTVISTGGGLATNEENLNSLKDHALVCCLWAGPDTIWRRVHHQSHRPLLNGPDPEAKIRELLEQREPHYRKADVLLNTEMRPLKEVAQHLVHQFHESAQAVQGG